MMAEDPSTPNSEHETRSSQSTVARLLLSGTLQHDQGDQQNDRKPANNDSSSCPLKVVISEPQFQDEQQFVLRSLEDMSPNVQDGGSSFSQSELSPDGYAVTASNLSSSGRLYSCRFCDFSTMTYTHLQLHMPRHGALKALKCPQCDYSTNDKSNFRRHKRLHQRNNPASLLRCEKCQFSTVVPRKMREHYNHDHGEEYPSPLTPLPPSCPPVVRIQGYRAEHFNGRVLSATRGNCSSGVIPVSTGTLHPLIASVPPGLHFAGANPPMLTNCLAQFHPYEVPIHQSSQETHMASDYLRSIVSNIITSHQAPRMPASSTITSSSFYLPTPMETTHSISASVPHSASDRQMHSDDSDDEVVVKSEPVECNGVPDVSCSASMLRRHHSEGTRQMETEASRRLSLNVVDGCTLPDRNNEASSSADLGSVVNSTEIRTCNSVPDNQRRVSTGPTSNITIKHEISNVGIQCAMPSVKREPTDSTDSSAQRRARHHFTDRGIQCELISSGRRFNCSSVSESSGDNAQSFSSVQTKCPHCGVTFDDEVLFSIHIGCHSHTDPFVCNVCGKPCHNKYGFYSHIMRGHQL